MPVLAQIFNHSIVTQEYPLSLKKSYIIPLNKCSLPSSPADTRPIANLSHLAKIFDKLITTQIMNHFENNNLLSPYQSGFRSHFSTETALLYLTDIIRNGIENGMVTLLQLFDYSKAFDTIKHHALLISLRRLGFSAQALNWIHSYITGRTQAVVDDEGNRSSFLPVTAGVPQGSSPGPVLFLALINFAPSVLKFCKVPYVMFADDFQLFVQCPINLLPFAIQHMNEDSNSLSSWSLDMGLTLNPRKIKSIIFGSSAMLTTISKMSLPSLHVDGMVIPIENRVKSLGVILSNDLSWNPHVAQISSKVHGVLHKLRSKAWLLSTEVKTLLVQSLVNPHIDYASLIYNDIPNYLNLKVQRLINAGIRYIFNLKNDEHITPYRLNLGWLKVENRRRFLLGCLIYKILKEKRPAYLYDKIVHMFTDVRRSARLQTAKIVIPTSRTTVYKLSFVI